MIESPELTKLKSFLNSLFQFENQDLDFGIYKILNYKRESIKNFIDTLLIDEVKSQLNILEETERLKLRKQLDELVKDEVIKGFVESKDENTKEVLKTVSKEKIENYLTLKEQLDSHVTTSNAEPVIYNHLTEFFKRYYDKGDFISKRRYSKNEKYVVPYNGEETYFYWANQDQYYIKSSEFFSKYSFKVLIYPNKECIVNFKLAEAQEESGNVKSESNKYFVLSKNAIEQTKDEINIFFEYCSIADEEKKSFGKNQDELNTNATDKILKSLEKNPAYTELKSIRKNEKNGKDEKNKKKEKSKLKYELDRYTNRNKYDFFIHKDLKGFLSRELDFYIKNEMLYLDDLSLFDSDTHLENIKLNLNIIKTFKNIADTIIDFVSQIENFQKKLWEKKKFVISTNYVITLDKLSEYTSKEFMEEVIKNILRNKDQIHEWNELFGKDLFKDWKIKANELKDDMYSYKKLPVDTKHFTDEFKWKILIEVSKKINIEEELTGLILHSDNFHGLNLLQEKYYEKLKGVYIDPPYNIGDDDFLYKDNFKHSSWLSMIHMRIIMIKELLIDGGIIYENIGEDELKNLIQVNNNIFYENNLLSIIPRVSKTASDLGTWFASSLDFVLCYSNNKENTPYFSIEVDLGLYRLIENNGKRKGQRYRDDIALYQSSLIGVRPNQRYFIECPDGSLVIPPGKTFPLIKKDGEIISPILGDNRWRWSKETYLKNKDLIVFKKTKTSPLLNEKREKANWNIYTKSYFDDRKEKGVRPRNFLTLENKFYYFIENLPNNIIEKYTLLEVDKISKIYFKIIDIDNKYLFADLDERKEIFQLINLELKKLKLNNFYKDFNSFDLFIQSYYKNSKNLVLTEFINRKGADTLKRFGINYPYSKPFELIEYLIGITFSDESNIFADFFAGSGTTGHAILKLNHDRKLNSKFILVELSNIANTIIIPRIKKVAFSFNWKEGKPVDVSGIGVFFKYQKLEQYEDSLENIAFKESKETKQLPIYKDYIPKYFLEFETSESKTFLNTEEMKNPFDYKLKVFDNYDYVEQSVDLIETFNYLIGLYVHIYQIEKDQNRDYYFISGKSREGKDILVIWRDVNKLDFKKDKVFLSKHIKNFTYNILYVNSQCAIEGYIQIETVFKNKMN